MLTNNHVIDDTTGLTATLVSTGQKYSAKWLGYDKTDDVVRHPARGRVRPDHGPARQLRDGEGQVTQVVAIGNAEGAGGKPTVVTGDDHRAEPDHHRQR